MSKELKPSKLRALSPDARVLGGGQRQGDKEVWRLASEGRVLQIATAPSSTAIMDQAVVIYEGALRRLAKK